MHDLYGDEMYHRLRCEDLLREAEYERLISSIEKMRVNNRGNHGIHRLSITLMTEPVKKNNRQIILEVH